MIELLPLDIREKYEVHIINHPLVILRYAYPNEWEDLLDLLSNFTLSRSDILANGGRKSLIANKLDGFLYDRGWKEKSFNTSINVDEQKTDVPTHKIDCFKNKVGIEIEWNNKDPFFDRDLNNFRLLFDLKALKIGIIITRASNLQNLFSSLGKGQSYGSSTTHMNKLIPRIDGGGGGGCPIAAFGITDYLYDKNS
jgi:hypothetical protein